MVVAVIDMSDGTEYNCHAAREYTPKACYPTRCRINFGALGRRKNDR